MQNLGYDQIIREDLPITERFNEEAYKRYLKLAKISEGLKKDAILKNFNCTGLIGDKVCFTNAGALFFRVNDEDVLFRHAGIVCVLYKGLSKGHILDAKELNGDIVSNVDNALIFLKKYLRASYKVGTPQRENVLELPEDALREAIVNAVCHRDYFEVGARVMVEIFDDRVDIVNPGEVCEGITCENFGTISITRNAILASMFSRIHYIEQVGTGITRMKNATREAKVADPEFDFSGFFRITFRRSISDQLPIPSKKEAIVENVINDREPVKTSDRKMMFLSYIKEHTKATTSGIADSFDLGKSRTREIIQEMISDGLIEKVGDNRDTYYVLSNDQKKKEVANDNERIILTDIGEQTKATTADISDSLDLNKNEDQKNKKVAMDKKQTVLTYIEEQAKATTSGISDFLDLSKNRAREILKEMVSDGLIERVGDNRDTHYVLSNAQKNTEVAIDNKQTILTYIEKHAKTTTVDMAELLLMSKERASGILREMTNDGIIEKLGNRRGTYYVLSKGQKNKQVTNDDEQMILTYIGEHTKVTTPDVAKLLVVNKNRAREILKEMISNGTIKKVGVSRHTYYVLKE